MSPPAFHADRDSGRLLPVFTRVGVGLLIVVAVVRAAVYLAYALLEIPASDQPYTLEGASVYFAWCVQHGLPLYPEGLGPSYAVNYMGPCYFWIVGLIGRWLDADVYGLYVIGRVVTFVCGLGVAAIGASYVHRRYGRRAALAALVFGLGSAPMFWYGARTRPDMMADFLGVAGFFIACGRNRWPGLLAAATLLAMSCLTKQSFGILWLAAAVLVLLTRQDSRQRALVLGGATAALVLAVVAILAVTTEPHVVSSLLGQGGMTFRPQQSLRIVMRWMDRSPEMVLFALVGCGLWIAGEHKDRTLLIATIVWLVGVVLTCAKVGSDLNYFIPLCVVEALAAGTLCVAALRATQHRLGWAAVTWTSVLAMAFSAGFAFHMASAAVERRVSDAGQTRRRQLAHYGQLAQDPDVRLLTDSDRLAIHQGRRAVLLDVFLFRLEVEAGRRDPDRLIERLRSRWFQYVILNADASGVYDDQFFYTLPADVAAAVTANYRLQSSDGGLFVYVPRETPATP